MKNDIFFEFSPISVGEKFPYMAVDTATINKRGAIMAQDELKQPAETGTDSASSVTPKWDSFDGETYPFLNLNEEQKRAGYRVTFLADKPRRETKNNFNDAMTDFWFDVVYEGDVYTWTISQVSLIMELRKHKSLKNKVFDVKLVPVDSEFKKQYPKFKGTDRYQVTYVETKEAVTASAKASDDSKKKAKEPDPHDAVSVEDL